MKISDPMKAMTGFALSAALIAAVPTPSPNSTNETYPEIGHVKTSAACTTLRKLTLPVGYVTKVNERAFYAMDRSLQKFLSGISSTDVPTSADLQQAIRNQSRAEDAQRQTQGQSNASAAANMPETGSQAAENMGTEEQDDSLIYNPQGVLSAANIDNVAMQIFQNLVLEDKIMTQSWKDYPAGSDAKVDALRQRAQNLIDLQRSLASRYEEFAGTYLDNQGMSQLKQDTERPAFKLFLRSLLLGEAGGLQSLRDPGDPSEKAQKEVSGLKKYGETAQIVRELRAQEHAFVPELINTYNSCNGADVKLQNGKNEPTPSPTPWTVPTPQLWTPPPY